MTSVYHSSSAEIPPTIIASPPSFSTLVETTVIKGNDIHPNRDPPVDSHPNYVDISPTFLTPEKKINCFSGNFPFDSDFEAMPSKEVADAFLEWYSKGMNMKRKNSPSSPPFVGKNDIITFQSGKKFKLGTTRVTRKRWFFDIYDAKGLLSDEKCHRLSLSFSRLLSISQVVARMLDVLDKAIVWFFSITSTIRGQFLRSSFVLFSINNGSSVRIVEDPWLPRPRSFKVYDRPSIPSQLRVIHLKLLNGDWDEDFIRTIFNPDDANLILQLPADSSNMEDKKEVGQADDNHIKEWWKLIWKLNIPQKVKHFVWNLAHSWLPTNATLASREMNIDYGCQWCHSGVKETVYHATWGCKANKGVWQLSGFKNKLQRVWDEDVMAFLMRLPKRWWTGVLGSCLSFKANINRRVGSGRESVPDGVLLLRG
uniref:Reverse transcriptase zinc-binding domain-containing protein n=1 Tax=Cannabis sativa TaxID=3483 RepID=A0A803PQS5_CANSA